MQKLSPRYNPDPVNCARFPFVADHKPPGRPIFTNKGPYPLQISRLQAAAALYLNGNLAITQGIQMVGVAYILYLAYKQWTGSGVSIDGVVAVEGARSLFGKGLLTGFSNPKAIIMFSAVFPQFAGAGEHNSMADIAILGLTFLVLQFASGCLYGYFGQRIKPGAGKPPAAGLVATDHGIVVAGRRRDAGAGLFPLTALSLQGVVAICCCPDRLQAPTQDRTSPCQPPEEMEFRSLPACTKPARWG